MLQRVEVTSTRRDVLRQLATRKCVAQQVSPAGSNMCNIVLNLQRNNVTTQVETICCLYCFTLSYLVLKFEFGK